MLVGNLATFLTAKSQLLAVFVFQQEEHAINWPALTIVVILFIMSAWSIGVMIDRWIAFNAARKQSRQFAPAVAGALREGKLDEAIKIADRYKKSHLAKNR